MPTTVGRASRVVPPRPPTPPSPARSADGSPPVAVVALVLVNLVPLFGVLFLDWSLLGVMTLYWFENGVIGLYALLGILLTEGRDDDAPTGCLALPQRLFMGAFFTFHYGAFWAVHGLFVGALFGADAHGDLFGAFGAGPLEIALAGPRIASQLLQGGLLLTAMGLVVSHGVSFVANVVVRGENLTQPPAVLMGRPYGRVVVLHVTLVLGGLIVMDLGEGVFVLLLLVLLKIAIDLWAHLRAHRPRPAAAASQAT